MYYKYWNLRGENTHSQIHSKIFFSLISSWYQSGSIPLCLSVSKDWSSVVRRCPPSAAAIRRRIFAIQHLGSSRLEERNPTPVVAPPFVASRAAVPSPDHLQTTFVWLAGASWVHICPSFLVSQRFGESPRVLSPKTLRFFLEPLFFVRFCYFFFFG